MGGINEGFTAKVTGGPILTTEGAGPAVDATVGYESDANTFPTGIRAGVRYAQLGAAGASDKKTTALTWKDGYEWMPHLELTKYVDLGQGWSVIPYVGLGVSIGSHRLTSARAGDSQTAQTYDILWNMGADFRKNLSDRCSLIGGVSVAAGEADAESQLKDHRATVDYLGGVLEAHLGFQFDSGK
jgi:hypothetical protein